MDATEDFSDSQILTVSMADFLDLRGESLPGTAFKFANSSSLGLANLDSKPYVDRAAMSARAIISTATVDRVGDSLVPMGCNLKNYTKNPVVLWGHGLEGVNTPIGTSCDPDGNLAIEITEDAVSATCFFSQKSLEAAQIFELVDEGVVKATSVRETPTKNRLVRNKSGQMVMVADEWELEEWSWCAIGVNPDAVAKAISKGKLAGRKIKPSILKSLNAVAPKKQVIGKGFKAAPQKEVVVMPTEDIEEPVAEVKSTVQPFGSQTLKAMHAALVNARSAGEACMKAMEHPKATPGLQAVIDCLKDQVTALQGLHSECYPQHAMKDDMSEPDDVDDSAMKAWLASGQTVRHQLIGVASALKGLSANDNLYPGQRKTLEEIAGLCNRWSSQAKSLKAQAEQKAAEPPPPAEPSAEEKLQEEINKLKADLSA